MTRRLFDAFAAPVLAALLAVAGPATTSAQARDDRGSSFTRMVDPDAEALLTAATPRARDSRVLVQSVLANLSEAFSKVYQVPRVALEGRWCRQPNAAYTALPRPRVVVCYELAQAIDRAFRGADSTTSDTSAARTLQFVVMHEVGHALADVLKLPTTGSTEDDADRFAMWHLLDVDEPAGERKLERTFETIAAVSASLRDASGKNIPADLVNQRLSNFACWYHGYVALTGVEGAPADLPGVTLGARAPGCRREFEALRSEWRGRLSDYVRHPAPTG